MHNRVGRSVTSYDISLLDGVVLAPLLAVIVFLAVYPQFALQRSEGSVKAAVYRAQTAAVLQGAPRSAAACPPAYQQRFEEVACGAGLTTLTYTPPLVIK